MRSFLFFILYGLITNYCISQIIFGPITYRDVDSTSIIRESDSYNIDFIDKNKIELEEFSNEDDAIIYIYRMKSMVGAAVKWEIVISDRAETKIKQLEYFTVHINTKQKFHYLEFPYIKFNYMNFEPNKYYIVKLKGMNIYTGYLQEENLKEILKCSPNEIKSVN